MLSVHELYCVQEFPDRPSSKNSPSLILTFHTPTHTYNFIETLLILNVSLWIECRILVRCDNMCSGNAINVLVVYFSELSETTVLMNLKKRYDQELIYVCMPNVKYANEITKIIKHCGNCLLQLLIHSLFCPLSFLSE